MESEERTLPDSERAYLDGVRVEAEYVESPASEAAYLGRVRDDEKA